MEQHRGDAGEANSLTDDWLSVVDGSPPDVLQVSDRGVARLRYAAQRTGDDIDDILDDAILLHVQKIAPRRHVIFNIPLPVAHAWAAFTEATGSEPVAVLRAAMDALPPFSKISRITNSSLFQPAPSLTEHPVRMATQDLDQITRTRTHYEVRSPPVFVAAIVAAYLGVDVD